MSLKRSVAFATQTLTITVPKNRRPKFELHLKIIDLNNVPLVSGNSFVKWHLPHSTAAEHRGRTEKRPIKDHKVSYDYESKQSVKMVVDKSGMLQESFIEFEVVQEYSGGGKGERITLGNVKLNLAEYVEQSEMNRTEGDEPGVTRRYLMQNSKINSTLKISIFLRQVEGDRNFVAPALKTAQVFSGIAGIVSGEQGDAEEAGTTPSLSAGSREAGELQDMYRRTLAAYWSAQPGELKADECIEDIFSGGDGWGDREKPYDEPRRIRFVNGDSSGSMSESESHKGSSILRKSHETLRPGDTKSSSASVRGRGSLEQQAHQMQAEAKRERRRPHHEVDEFEIRDDFRRRDAFDEEVERDAKPILQPRPQLSEHPLGRVRKRKGGRSIRETTARLEGTKTLGEDASILVLEELGDGKKKEATPGPELVQDDEQLPLKLAEALADEKPATLEEVLEQLDKLRRKATNDEDSVDEHYVSQTVYTRLSDHLLRAFTVAQLSHYYSERKGVEKDRVAQEVRVGLKQMQGKGKRPSERSEWTPGRTQIDRRLPSLDVHSKMKRKAIGKHLLVDQILRDVWKLVMLEELEAAGEIELALKDWQLVMLTSGTPETALDRIGEARKAKLEVNAADKVLRITADKHTAEYAADDVERLLQASESRRFHLNEWIPHLETLGTAEPTTADVFPEDVRATVASLTGAQIQIVTDKTVVIRALDKETIADAERSLIKLLPLKNLQNISVDTTGRDVLEGSDHFLPVVVEKEAVAYKDRRTKVGRWSLPVNQANASLHASDSITERVKTAQELVVTKLMTPPTQYQRTGNASRDIKYRKWTYHPEARLTAVFGHALFPLDDPTTGKPRFFPALPGLSSIFSDEAFRMGFVMRPSLCYEFIAEPGPKNYTSDLSPYKFPRLSAYFRPDNEGQHALSKVVLNFAATKHRVLLPEQAVDIQFQTSQSIQMQNVRLDQDARLLQNQVLPKLQGGGRLSAPDISVDIPKWTVEGMEFDGKEDFVKTKFIFTGITFSQSIWGQHQGQTTKYVTRQGGKLGAKTGIFSTVYGMNGLAKKLAHSDPPNAMRDFVANAFKMAGTITQAAAASQAGMKKLERKVKPQHSFRPRSQSAGGTTSPTINEQASFAQAIENDAKTTADSNDNIEALPEAKTTDGAFDVPQVSAILNDTASPGNVDEAHLSDAQEEPKEEEQKRRLDTAA
ncbi:uncharacterized protein N0V89_001506 [Didymosphaeria variabile]|uniref:C2 NT-type domain-containing protein n=1 Tax=Didymosphaeria variabile TaxID=1932322 RepID=A0A9W8XWA4_9PLEO|nr:uncharacterized protein N0V89_001506 [Didymosphaeria variabile]KAJ4360937.1 hypothetical protein N0V89_001506 [Didymosphaeria variabile]